MTRTLDDPRGSGVETAMLKWASALIEDPVKAQALVTETLAKAQDDRASPSRTELFRMLRQGYHSIERSRTRRPMRDADVTAMAQASGGASTADVLG